MAIYYSEYEETLFSPLPASLWDEGENSETEDSPHGVLPHTVRSRALQNDEGSGNGVRTRAVGQKFVFKSATGTSVKSLFNDGCLFAYATTTNDDESIPSPFSSPERKCRSREYPRSPSSTIPSSTTNTSVSFSNQFQRERHRFRI